MRKICGAVLIITAIYSNQLLKAADTTKVDVNIDLKHTVGGVSEFERQKFITIHASLLESDWNGAADKLDYMLNTLDVHLGRDNGGINWWLTQFDEDKNQPGYADSVQIISRGQTRKTQYKDNTERNIYDTKADIMVGGQTHAIWPGLKPGWQFADAFATGDYLGRYIKDFHRKLSSTNKNEGHPQPRFLEVLNEPLYELIDDPNVPAAEKSTPIEVFRFHRDVARGVKKVNPETKVGGYTAAFPVFEENNFQRWHDRMKLFIDTAGADMDFYSFHLYDFNRHWRSEYKAHEHYKGSRTEATIDMMEQYGMLKFGEVKPMIISEYGGRDLTMENKPWTPERDWMVLKALSPLLMSFIDRPDNIVKTIPFIVNKAEWGRKENGIPYGPRLVRQRFEDPNDTGDEWVFTELVKFYQLWSGVRGTRVSTWSENPDVRTAAYVIGPKAHLVFSNLAFDRQTIDLSVLGSNGNKIKEIQVKQLYGVNDFPTLEITNPDNIDQIILEPEATSIVELTFETIIDTDENLNEKKYYATSYLKEIVANQAIDFQVEGISKTSYGNAQLRVSFGRATHLSKKPLVRFNGNPLNVPENISGESQDERDAFFGMLEIPVPWDLINESNKVEITFPDGGGYVSSVTLRAFSYSREVKRSDSVQSLSLYPVALELGIGQDRILTAHILPSNAGDMRVNWASSDETILTVDAEGKITGKKEGSATITATSFDGGFTETCSVLVKQNRVTVEVDSVVVIPAKAEIIVGDNLQLNYQILPVDADNKTIIWSSERTGTATVNSSGNVSAKNDGVVNIVATATNGKKGISQITCKTKIPGNVELLDRTKHRNTIYHVGGQIKVSANFTATTGNTVDNKGVKFWLRELRSNWSVVKDYVVYDSNSAGKFSGTASATISLEGVTPTSQLAGGNFYFLWVSFTENNGDPVSTQYGVSPVKIERTTGVNSYLRQNFKVYPNPASEEIYIQSDFLYNKIVLYTLTGLKINEKITKEKNISIKELKDGIYFIEISNETKRAVSKLSIQR